MSSPNHPTTDIKDAFSSKFPNYTTASPNYFPASPENISLDPLDNLSKYLLASLAISPFHNMQAYNVPPKRTSTSETSAMTHAVIRKLVANSVATALEAQAVMMASTNNPNRNLGQEKLLEQGIMSSPTHLTPSDVDDEYTFPSANILDYILALPNYFPATLRNISSDFLENSKNNEIPLVFSSFYNNPYLKDMQAFYAKESPIPPPNPITPPVILTPSLKPITINESLRIEGTPPTERTTTTVTTTLAMITINNIIRGKKPSGLPTKGTMETFPYVKDAPYIT
nr:hypothetical protein [Tanacetum cinerariifolium]